MNRKLVLLVLMLSCSATVADELLVAKSTRWPAARNSATASADPGIARWASQTTPSRSHNTGYTFALYP